MLKSLLERFANNSFLKQAGKDTFFYSVAQVGSKLIGIIALPILARSLSKAEFADYDLFIVVSNFLMLVITLGTDSGMIVNILDGEENNNYRKVISFSLSIALIVGIVICFITWAIAYFWESRFNIWLVCGCSLFAFLASLQGIIAGYLRWVNKSEEAALLVIATNAAGLLLGLTLAYFHPNQYFHYFILGLLCGGICSTIFGLMLCKSYLLNPFQASYRNEFFKFIKTSLPFVPTSLLNNVISNLDRIIIFPIFGDIVYSNYALCSRIVQIPRMLLGIIGGGLQPSLLKAYQTVAGSLRIKKVYEILIASFPIILIITWLLKNPILSFFGGSQYPDAHRYLVVMMATGLFSISIYFNGWGYSISKKTGYLGILMSSFAVVNFSTNYFIAKNFGITNMLIGSLLLTLLLSITYTLISEKLYSFKYNIQLIALSLCISTAIGIGSLFI